MVYCISLGDLEKKLYFDVVRGAEGLTIRSIRAGRLVSSRSVEYSLQMVYVSLSGDLEKKSSFVDGEGCRRLIDPFDLYGSLSAFSLRRVQLTDGILHPIGETWKKELPLMMVRGAEGLTIRSIRTDCRVHLRSVEFSCRMVYCISLASVRKKKHLVLMVWGQKV